MQGKEKPSALEQIAELKLLHLPKALARGVNMIILDSDVGFLNNPMNLLNVMDKSVDMYVQVMSSRTVVLFSVVSLFLYFYRKISHT